MTDKLTAEKAWERKYAMKRLVDELTDQVHETIGDGYKHESVIDVPKAVEDIKFKNAARLGGYTVGMRFDNPLIEAFHAMQDELSGNLDYWEQELSGMTYQQILNEYNKIK